MQGSRLMIPLLNREVVTLEGPTWYLSDNTYLDTVSDTDFGAFHRADPGEDYKSQLEITTKCVYVDHGPGNTDHLAKNTATVLGFVLNALADKAPVVLSWVAIFQGTRTVKLASII